MKKLLKLGILLFLIPALFMLLPKKNNEVLTKGVSSVTLEATEDAVVYSGNPATNYGNIATNETGHSTAVPATDRYFYIKFQPINIPADATLNSATVQLGRAGWGCWGTATPDKLSIGRVIQNWSENAITWNTMVASAPSGSADASCASATWELDAKTIVSAWRSGSPNYGFIIYSNGTNNYQKTAYSSEEGSAARRPKLVLNYTTPDVPPAAPATPAAPSTPASPTTPVPGANITLPAANTTKPIDESIKTPALTSIVKKGQTKNAPITDEVVLSRYEKITLSGTSFTGAKVVVFAKDKAFDATTAADGTWTLELDATDLVDGSYSITAQAQKDTKGSEKPELLKIKVLAVKAGATLVKSSKWNIFYALIGIGTLLLVLLLLLLIAKRHNTGTPAKAKTEKVEKKKE